jgi:hypothetical protein
MPQIDIHKYTILRTCASVSYVDRCIVEGKYSIARKQPVTIDRNGLIAEVSDLTLTARSNLD